MEELEKNKQFNILKWVFIIISLVHVVYATIVFRGIYEDGSVWMVQLLNNFSNGSCNLEIDWGHTRFIMMALVQLPVLLAYKLLNITNKYLLMHIFTFFQFFMPLLVLFWNYKLTKRTGRIDILCWNLFIYGCINITFSIFSVVEIITGSIFNFILWNYMASKINYTKKDIFYITCLLIIMFGTYEYITVLGIIFFVAALYYASKETIQKNKLVKTYIAIGSLLSSIFNILYMLRVPNEGSEILRFLKEAHDFLPLIFNLNITFTFIAIAIIIMLMFRKTLLTNNLLILISAVFICMFIRLSNTPVLSIYPMWEQHLRTIPCWLIPLLFIGMWISDIIKEEKNKIKFINYICVILICSITQTCWQFHHDYYWNKNVEYLKNELENTQDILYIPAEHEEISSFHNDKLRRYIWFGTFPSMSILFSKEKEIKPFLLTYDMQDEGNITGREFLFVPKEEKNIISIPYGNRINITNDFWDLTKCAEALDKYNKKHKIKTIENMQE